MGVYNGAEIYELVGGFLLYQHSNKYNKKDIGVYQADGFADFENKASPQAESIKKDFQKFFRENGLNVSWNTLLKSSIT